MTNEFYAVLTERYIHHEGDERSRTHPGHGYPAYTETVSDLKRFTDKEALENWIRFHGRDTKYEVLKCIPMKVSTEVKISIE